MKNILKNVDGSVFPRHSQRNDKVFPGSVCGKTSIGMVSSYLAKKDNKDYIFDDDELMELLNTEEVKADFLKLANTEVSSKLKMWLIRKRDNSRYTYINQSIFALKLLLEHATNCRHSGIIKYWSWDAIKNEIDNGHPILFATNLTKSGHYVVIVGYDDELKKLIINDPWGDYRTGYSEKWNGWEIPVSFEQYVANAKEDKDRPWVVEGQKIYGMGVI